MSTLYRLTERGLVKPPRWLPANVEERLRQWAADKEADLERAYAQSKLPATPDEAKLKALLLSCLEEHYGTLDGCVVQPDRAIAALRAVQMELDRVRDLL